MIDPKKLRQIAGCFATGVTIVSAYGEDNEIRGMTANSFLSVSLDPPLILFSVKKGAHFLQCCAPQSKLSISILSEDQKFISNQFAGINEEDIPVEFDEANGFALIKHAIAWYKLEVEKSIPAGDHQLILCSIIDLDGDRDKKPLLYHSGYKKLGASI